MTYTYKYIVASSNPTFPDTSGFSNWNDVLQFIENRKSWGFCYSILEISAGKFKYTILNSPGEVEEFLQSQHQLAAFEDSLWPDSEPVVCEEYFEDEEDYRSGEDMPGYDELFSDYGPGYPFEPPC
jgi:hypothetical protein